MNTANYNKSEIIHAFYEGAQIIDNHDDSIITDDVLLIEFVGSNKELSLVQKNAKYQCLNAVYLTEDGKIHLSQMSIAGTIERLEFHKYNESCTFESFKIKRAITRNGSNIIVDKSEETYEEEDSIKLTNLDRLKFELEDLLMEEKDSRILDLQRISNNIRNNVKQDSRTYKIANKIYLICTQNDVKFDDISELVKRAINTMVHDLTDNDILLNRHDPKVAQYLNEMEVKLLF